MFRFRRMATGSAAALLLVALAAGCSGGGAKSGGGTPSGRGAVRGTVDSRAANGQVQIEGLGLRGTIDAHGAFNLPSVPPGEYTLSVVAPDGQGASVIVRVIAGQTTEVSDVKVNITGQIAGIVRDSVTGARIVGARVSARNVGVWYLYDKPNSSGGSGSAPGASGGTTNGAAASVANGIAANAPAGARRQSTTGGAFVAVPPRTATTDATGSYLLQAVDPGPYAIEVQADGYESGSTGTYVSEYGSADGGIALKPILKTNATLKGTVTDGTLPLSQVRVDLWPQYIYVGPPVMILADGTKAGDALPSTVNPACMPPWYVGNSTVTDEQGGYVFRNITPGNYRLVFQRFGYGAVTREIVLKESDAQVQDAVLATTLATLSGKVSGVQVSGVIQPLAGATVYAWTNVYYPQPVAMARGKQATNYLPIDGNVLGKTLTAADGTWTMTVEAGTVMVVASAQGYNADRQLIEVVAPGKSGVDFKLTVATDPTPVLPPIGIETPVKTTGR